MNDVVIVGGGIIGAATAYFLSKEGRKVKVIERDPTYKTASFPLSLGGFRRQFFQTENILLGKFAREFIFQIPELLKTEKKDIVKSLLDSNLTGRGGAGFPTGMKWDFCSKAKV